MMGEFCLKPAAPHTEETPGAVQMQLLPTTLAFSFLFISAMEVLLSFFQTQLHFFFLVILAQNFSGVKEKQEE